MVFYRYNVEVHSPIFNPLTAHQLRATLAHYDSSVFSVPISNLYVDKFKILNITRALRDDISDGVRPVRDTIYYATGYFYAPKLTIPLTISVSKITIKINGVRRVERLPNGTVSNTVFYGEDIDVYSRRSPTVAVASGQIIFTLCFRFAGKCYRGRLPAPGEKQKFNIITEYGPIEIFNYAVFPPPTRATIALWKKIAEYAVRAPSRGGVRRGNRRVRYG